MKTMRKLTLYLGFFRKIKQLVSMSALFRVITVNRDHTHLLWIRRGRRLLKNVFPLITGKSTNKARLSIHNISLCSYVL